MKKRTLPLKALFRLPEIYLFFVTIFCVIFFILEQAQCQNVKIQNEFTSSEASFPISKKMDENERMRVVFDIETKLNVFYSLKIIPDDCVDFILINDKPLNVTSIKNRCNYNGGFVLDQETLKPFIKKGSSHFEIDVKNDGGPGGLNVFVQSELSFISYIIRSLFILSVLLLSIFILRRLKISFAFAFILGLGILIRIFLFQNIPYTQYSYDYDGHVEYVKLISEYKQIPEDKECWTCYHPPIYYSMSQLFWNLGPFLTVSRTHMLQFQSLLFSFFVLIFGFFIFKKFLSGGGLYYATILWCFWPTLILSSPRIGNDQLFYLTHIITLWLCIKYLVTNDLKRGKYLLAGVLVSAISYWTKGTGIISIGILIFTMILGYFPRESLKPTKTELMAIIATILLLVTILSIKLFGSSTLIGNAISLHGRLRVGNDPANYLFFDVRDFIVNPYASAWDDAGGRQYFWNYLFKTSLFGEFKILATQVGLWLASFISLSFLGLIVLALRGWWKSKLTKVNVLLIVQAFAFIAAILFLRMKYSYSCSNDFRYILPILISVIPFVGMGALEGDLSFKWKTLACITLAIFVCSSVVLLLLA